MEQHDKSGRAVAAFLEDHPKVKKIYYPGSRSHKQHELAKRQQKGFAAWFHSTSARFGTRARSRVSEALHAGGEPGRRRNLSLPPGTMTHASVAPEVRERLGITDGLVRISVGSKTRKTSSPDLDQALSTRPVTSDE